MFLILTPKSFRKKKQKIKEENLSIKHEKNMRRAKSFSFYDCGKDIIIEEETKKKLKLILLARPNNE
jgi:hypothetical protein